MVDLEGNEETFSGEELFPAGLARWAGHRDGGVRRPFRKGSGRPTGQQIETPLIKRLRDWVHKLVSDNDVPRVIFLIGGPGNGKTDAIEGCIECFDHELDSGGSLTSAFADKYEVAGGGVPPRKAVVDLSSIRGNVPEHLQTSISLVQDATESDSSRGSSPEELLLNELDQLLDPDFSGIYLCCVNRGILARTAEIAHSRTVQSDVSALLTKVVESVTSGPDTPNCWPLDDFSRIAVWPMDVESLVDKSVSEDGKSVAHLIFELALDQKKWKDPCDLKSRCPFCQNRKLLIVGDALNSLISILHYYELVSGKRWTFRDIFSLIAYLLVGEHTELEIKGKYYSPCEWAAEQHRLANEGRSGSVERERAPFLLMSRLYHHRLFPRWPDFNRGEHRKSRREIFKGGYTDKGLIAARSFFRFTAHAKALTSKANGDIPVRIRDSMGPALDPALVTGDEILISRNGVDIQVDEIESRFSLSIKEGLDFVSSQLETLERDVLERLSLADDSLVEDRFPRNRTRQARILQSTLRQFSARLAKRRLGTKRGVCRDIKELRDYLDVTHSTEALNDVRKGLRSLLHDSNNKFRAGLATTFGQPVAHRSKDVALLLQTPVHVNMADMKCSDRHPSDYLPYLLVKDHYVALTFELFKALSEVKDGLHDASLPSEIFSLLDRVKSLVSGQVVRDGKVLSDDPVIMLGSSGEKIEYVNGKFLFSKESST